MIVNVVRLRGRLDSLCFVSLLNDVPCVVYTKVPDPFLIFSFPFRCFLFYDDGACSTDMWQPPANGWAFDICVRCAWCMSGKKSACKTSNHPLNF
mmetsp:Transcript_5823/g.8645  ORF Transcript_5823/g.8645 Transcript_5823/m.8645 type:complete len:95 (+) Transcript_5823:29-313(+)